LRTWEQESLKCIRDDTNLDESLEGEEGETTTFPLLCMWWDSILSPLLVWEDYTSEFAGGIWTFGLTGGGGTSKEIFFQPQWWETVG
jgi:hypothetical protein